MVRPIVLAFVIWMAPSWPSFLSGQDLPPVPPLPIHRLDTAPDVGEVESLPEVPQETRQLPRPLREIAIDASPPSLLTGLTSNPREAGAIILLYTRRGTRHERLYFEDARLEQSGQSRWPRLQPGVSAVRFGTDTLLFPWRAVSGHGVGSTFTPGLE